MKANIEELLKIHRSSNKRMTSKDIRNISEEKYLYMDYFLNEDDLFADETDVESFISSNLCHLIPAPGFVQAFFIYKFNKIELSYNAKNQS